MRVRGTVQGVGFRPFVYRQARRLGVAGFVLNDALGVLIEAEGRAAALDELVRVLGEEAPPLARVASLEVLEVPPLGEGAFEIRSSETGASPAAPVSADTATCDDCLAELWDPGDRRYRYPFVNCTNCGPRYTIVLSVPYDRRRTTMAGFEMCAACRDEYEDPGSRRFHAQPNACPACGPQLAYLDPSGGVLERRGEALAAAVAILSAGGVVAVKGLGGYHLAAVASDERAVGELRRRKARDDKPFAVMVQDVATARELCDLDGEAEAALVSPSRPVVLARRAGGGSGGRAVARAVAPGLAELGVMLPYSPLHHLLLSDAGSALVMTSGNLSDEPIAHEDSEAVGRLGPLVDGLLVHDRPIHVRCDDSVVRSRPSRLQAIRRSRGFAPEPLPLPSQARRPVLAVGAMLKNTVSVAKGHLLVASHHIGDLEHLATYRSFLQATEHLCKLHGVAPEAVAHDLHPEYLSTKYALDLDLEPWPVQHHHAHVASLLVEHGRLSPVLGIAFDGLGAGPDGTLWGGELLVADLTRYRRVGHLLAVPLPGGSSAIREPWRMALSWAREAGGDELAARLGPLLDPRWEQVLAVARSNSSPVTSSAGRLFDAVAAISGGRKVVSYEGQAAIELEVLAAGADGEEPERWPVFLEVAQSQAGPQLVVDPRPLVSAVAAARLAGLPAERSAAAFHGSLAAAVVEAATRLASSEGLGAVALTGGVFQNAILSRLVEAGLARAGLEVLVHGRVPPNDGGVSIGQAAIAALGERPEPGPVAPGSS